MNILEIEKPLKFDTPKGKAIAYFLIDYGPEMDLLWVCFLQDNGQCWTFPNKEIRLEANYSLHRNI